MDPTVFGDSPAAIILGVITANNPKDHEKVARFLCDERHALNAIIESNLDAYMRDWALQARQKHAEARARTNQFDHPRICTHLINVIVGEVRNLRHARKEVVA